MSGKRPEYHLRRVEENGETRPLTVHSLHQLPRDLQLARRDFFGLGTTVAAAIAMMGGEPAAAQDEGAGPKRATVVFAHTASVLSLAFSADGDYLVSSSADKLAKIWRLEDGKVMAHLEDHDGSVNDVAISPNGKRLATASYDETVRLWSFPDGGLLGTLFGPKAGIYSVSFSSDNLKLAVGAANGQAHLWRVGEKIPLEIPTGHGSVRRVACNPGHEHFASAGRDGVLRYWSTRDGRLLAESAGHAGTVTALAFSGNGSLLAGGGTDNNITLRSIGERDRVQTLEGHKGDVVGLAISSDGKLLASASKDKTVRLWKIPEGDLTEKLSGPNEFTSVAISPGGSLLAAGDAKGVITLWDLTSRRLIGFLFDSEASAVNGSIFSVKTGTHFLSYTLPCGSAIPAGATCTCNCVSGTYRVPVVERKEDAKSRPVPEDRLVEGEELTPLQRRIRALQIKREQRLARQAEFAAAQQAAAMEYLYYMQQFVPASSGSSSTTTCVCIPVYR